MISVCPPEYCPRLEYVAMMLLADTFVLADTYQYSRQSFQNRAKVRNPEGWQWVSIPLRGGQHGRPQMAVEIRQVEAWRKRHWKAFAFNYRPTPFFAFYEEALRSLYARSWTHLSELVCASVQLMHECLGLSCTVVRASALPGCPADLESILRCVGSRTLLSIPQAAAYDAEVAASVHVLRLQNLQYQQAFPGFEEGMTAFDLLFNYGPEAIRIMRRSLHVTPYTEQ